MEDGGEVFGMIEMEVKTNGILKTLISVPSLVLVALLSTSCGQEQWSGTVYPDRSNLRNSRSIGTYSSLQDCRAAAQIQINRLPEPQMADYECGLNCKDQGGILICDSTRK